MELYHDTSSVFPPHASHTPFSSQKRKGFFDHQDRWRDHRTNQLTVYPAFTAPNIKTPYRKSCGPTYARILVSGVLSSFSLPHRLNLDTIHHAHLSTDRAKSLYEKSLYPWETSSLLTGKDTKGRVGLRAAISSMRVGRGRVMQAWWKSVSEVQSSSGISPFFCALYFYR